MEQETFLYLIAWGEKAFKVGITNNLLIRFNDLMSDYWLKKQFSQSFYIIAYWKIANRKLARTAEMEVFKKILGDLKPIYHREVFNFSRKSIRNVKKYLDSKANRMSFDELPEKLKKIASYCFFRPETQ